MLVKLFKHELKAASKMMAPVCIAFFIVTLMMRIAVSSGIFFSDAFSLGQVLSQLTVFMYVVAITALMVMITVVVAYRFYKNLMTDEGYLMFTLPVKPWQHIISKLTVAFIWSFIGTLVIILSVFLLAYDHIPYNDVHRAISEAIAEMGNYSLNLPLLIFESVIYMIISTIESILLIYLSIAIGQLSRNHKIALSFGAYFGIIIILQIIYSIISIILFGSQLYLPEISTGASPMAMLQAFMFGLLIIPALLTSVAAYLGVHALLKNKLNLE